MRLLTLAVLAVSLAWCCVTNAEGQAPPTPIAVARPSVRIFVSGTLSDRAWKELSAMGVERGYFMHQDVIDPDNDGSYSTRAVKAFMAALPPKAIVQTDWEGTLGHWLHVMGPEHGRAIDTYVSLLNTAKAARKDCELGPYGMPRATNNVLCGPLLEDAFIAGTQYPVLRASHFVAQSGYKIYPGDIDYWGRAMTARAIDLADYKPTTVDFRTRYAEDAGDMLPWRLTKIPPAEFVAWVRLHLSTPGMIHADDRVDRIWLWADGEPSYRRYSNYGARGSTTWHNVQAFKVWGERYVGPEGSINEALIQSDVDEEVLEYARLMVIARDGGPIPVPPTDPPPPVPTPPTDPPTTQPNPTPPAAGRSWTWMSASGQGTNTLTIDAQVDATIPATRPGNGFDLSNKSNQRITGAAIGALASDNIAALLVNNGQTSRQVHASGVIATAAMNYGFYFGDCRQWIVENCHITQAAGAKEHGVRGVGSSIVLRNNVIDTTLAGKRSLWLYAIDVAVIEGGTYKGGAFALGAAPDAFPGADQVTQTHVLVRNVRIEHTERGNPAKLDFPAAVNIWPGCDDIVFYRVDITGPSWSRSVDVDSRRMGAVKFIECTWNGAPLTRASMGNDAGWTKVILE